MSFPPNINSINGDFTRFLFWASENADKDQNFKCHYSPSTCSSA